MQISDISELFSIMKSAIKITENRWNGLSTKGSKAERKQTGYDEKSSE